MKAVILAGGKGTRLGSATRGLPKPMVEVAGRPLLVHLLDLLNRYGISEVILLTGYLGEVIEDYFAGGQCCGIKVSCLREDQPLGTSGALGQLKGRLKSDFLLLYGDVFAELKLDRLVTFHQQNSAAVTLVAHPSDHPYDSDLLDADEDGRLKRIICKPHDGLQCGNLGNAAMYVLSPVVFDYIPAAESSDFMRDVFPKMLEKDLPIYAYRTAEYLKDMGTPERFARVSGDVASGRTKRLSLEASRPAIFFDRDGTLIEHVHLLHRPQDLKLIPGVSETLRRVNRSDYLALLVTNQPVVARNLVDFPGLRTIHNRLEQLLGEQGSYLDDICYCPHHPDAGYPEENAALKIACDCRKPKLGMIEALAQQNNIDLSQSWMVGDTSTDIQTGENAGMRTVLVQTGLAGNDGKYQTVADYCCADVSEAVNLILEQSEERQ